MKRWTLVVGILVPLAAALAAANWGARALESTPAAKATPVVRTVPTEQVLAWIGQGKRVIFVDAREPEEFDEEHIPGAMNVSLRELQQMKPEQFQNADLIVAYCMKDFRGYEVAKALHRAGFPQSAIMKEYGIAGWKKQGLPVVKQGGPDEKASQAQLQGCIHSTQGCIRKQG